MNPNVTIDERCRDAIELALMALDHAAPLYEAHRSDSPHADLQAHRLFEARRYLRLMREATADVESIPAINRPPRAVRRDRPAVRPDADSGAPGSWE